MILIFQSCRKPQLRQLLRQAIGVSVSRRGRQDILTSPQLPFIGQCLYHLEIHTLAFSFVMVCVWGGDVATIGLLLDVLGKEEGRKDGTGELWFAHDDELLDDLQRLLRRYHLCIFRPQQRPFSIDKIRGTGFVTLR